MDDFFPEPVRIDLCSRTVRYSQAGETKSKQRKRLILGGIGSIRDDSSQNRSQIGPVQIQLVSFNLTESFEWKPSDATKTFIALNELSDLVPIGEFQNHLEDSGFSTLYLGVKDDTLNWLIDITSERQGKITDFEFEANIVFREVSNWDGPIGDGYYPVQSWEISHSSGEDVMAVWSNQKPYV